MADEIDIYKTEAESWPYYETYSEDETSLSWKEEPILEEKAPVAQRLEKDKPKWTEEQTKLMLNLHAQHWNNVGPEKKFRNKKTMWAFFAQELEKKMQCKWTGVQVETRYRCIMKRTKKAIDYNYTLRAEQLECQFEKKTTCNDEMAHPPLPEFVLLPNISNNHNCTGSVLSTEILKPQSQIECTSNDFPSTSSSSLSSSTFTSREGSPNGQRTEKYNNMYAKWTDEQTNFLLSLYAKCCNNVGRTKKFRNKKRMWTFVAKEIEKKFQCKWTALQVLTRYKCVMKRTKKSVGINIYNMNTATKEKPNRCEEESNRLHTEATNNALFPDFVLAPGVSTKKGSDSVLTTVMKPQLQHKTSSCLPSTSNIGLGLLSTIDYSEPLSTVISSPRVIEAEANSNNSRKPRLRQRERKTLQETIFEKYITLKEKRHMKMEKLFRESEENKAKRYKEKEEARAKRHDEKMKKLDEFIKLQSNNT